jgi:hypothetical protein
MRTKRRGDEAGRFMPKSPFERVCAISLTNAYPNIRPTFALEQKLPQA